jgi:hypothetical protein
LASKRESQQLAKIAGVAHLTRSRKAMEMGKYQNVAKISAQLTEAEAVVLIVVNGTEGSGFSIHADSGIRELLPRVLRKVAREISDSEMRDLEDSQ